MGASRNHILQNFTKLRHCLAALQCQSQAWKKEEGDTNHLRYGTMSLNWNNQNFISPLVSLCFSVSVFVFLFVCLSPSSYVFSSEYTCVSVVVSQYFLCLCLYRCLCLFFCRCSCLPLYTSVFCVFVRTSSSVSLSMSSFGSGRLRYIVRH